MSVDVEKSRRVSPVTGEVPVDRPANRIAGPRAMEPVWRSRLRRTIGWVGADRRRAFAIGLGLALLWGVIAGGSMPRGPLTTSEAVSSIAVSVAVGGLAGAVMRTRWSMLAAPIAFALAFELARVGTDGPLVDGFHLSTYGVLAFAVGRGFHASVSLMPMLWAAAIGAGLARRVDAGEDAGGVARSRRVGTHLRRGAAVVAGIGLLVFTIGLLRPASTDAIVDAEGGVIPGSVAELTTVDVNGHDLAMMIRGHSVDNPVLLFLAGGPGGSELGAMRNHLPALEQHFIVATWDQRGTGKSYPELDPTDTLTLDGVISDTIVVTDYLRERFGQDRIYLVGQSWGSTLGVLAMQESPERYAAFVGVGQMVSQLATDTIFYEDTLAWAEASGNAGLASELRSIGPPPYESVLDYETALSYEHEVYPYEHGANSEGEGGFSENFIVEEYTLLEQAHVLAGFMDTFNILYPQLQAIDFRATATTFEVPVFFVQGAHEADGRAEVFDDWYPTISAPTKDLVVLETSGHRPLFEQPDEFVDYLVDTVLDRTSAP